jgi:hypothetical protein
MSEVSTEYLQINPQPDDDDPPVYDSAGATPGKKPSVKASPAVYDLAGTQPKTDASGPAVYDVASASSIESEPALYDLAGASSVDSGPALYDLAGASSVDGGATGLSIGVDYSLADANGYDDEVDCMYDNQIVSLPDTRSTAEEKLRSSGKDGAYLIRTSTNLTKLVLSIYRKHDNTVLHYAFTEAPPHRMYVSETEFCNSFRPFDTVRELISYFKTHQMNPLTPRLTVWIR